MPEDYIAGAQALLDASAAGGLPYEAASQKIERAKVLLLMDIAHALSDISQDLKAIGRTTG